jgi:hypothetical protein
MLTVARPILLVLLAAFAAPCSFGAVPAEKLLAPDTLGFVSVPNWPAAAAALRQNSLGQLWADPAMRPFREKFQARFKAEALDPLEKELGVNLPSLAELFQGQVTLAFTATPPDSQPGRSSGFILLADTGGKSAQLSTNLARLRKQWVDAGKQVKPIKLHEHEFSLLVFSPAELARILDRILPNPEATNAPAPPSKPFNAEWTIGQSGSLLIVSDSAREVDKVLTRQAAGGPSTLAEQKEFAAEAGVWREAQVYGWVNFRAVMERVVAGPPPGAPGAEDKETVSLGQLLLALGFGGLQTATVSLNESSAGSSVVLRVKAPEAARAGLFKTLNLESKDSSPPPFVPADAIKFSRARLDLPKMWGNLETMLAEASPPAASFLKFIIATAGKDQDEKFDLREKLIARLGDDLISYDKSPRRGASAAAEAAPSLMLVGSRNADQVAVAMKALAGLLPPQSTKYKEREFLGRPFYSVTMPRTQDDGRVVGESVWCYAAGRSYVALSSDAALVESYLRNLEGTSRSLRDQTGLAEAAQKVGGMNTGYFSYENTAETARVFFEAAGKTSLNAAAILGAMKLGGRFGLGQEGGLLSWGDFGLLPPYERVAKYFYLDASSLSLDPAGYTYRFFAPTPPALRK